MFGFGKSKEVTCPFCKSYNIVPQGATNDSGKAKVKYICNNCGKEFAK
jgi:transposase-like protein